MFRGSSEDRTRNILNKIWVKECQLNLNWLKTKEILRIRNQKDVGANVCSSLGLELGF